MRTEQKDKYNLIAKIIFYIVLIGTLLLHYRSVKVPIIRDIYHAFRSSETALVVQDYFRNGFSLFHYSMPVFGKPWNVMFEFPLYQALVYGVMRLFGITYIDFCARIVSIIIFYLCVLILVRFAAYVTDRINGYFVGITFLLSAYNLYWSSAVLIDYLSVFLAFVYLLCLCKSIDKGKTLLYICGMCSGILGYMTKGTTFFAIVFFAAFYIILHECKLIFVRKAKASELVVDYLRTNIERLIYLFTLAVIPALCGLLWTKYADETKNLSMYSSWLSSKGLSEWNHGTFSQKLDANQWMVIWDRYEKFFGTGWILLFVVVIYFVFSSRKYWKVVVLSFVAQIFTVFMLFNLFFVHNYYLIELTPFVYLMFGTMVYEILQIKVRFNVLKSTVIAGAFMIYMFFQFANNQDYVYGTFYEPSNEKSVGTYLQKITEDNELLVVLDEDWSPVTLYDANRRGFMVTDDNMLYDRQFNEFLKDDNYSTFLTHTDEGIEAVYSLDGKVEQYALDSSFTPYETTCIYKRVENKVTDDYNNKKTAYDNECQLLSEVSDGNTFSIHYVSDRTVGIHGYIKDKNDDIHDFMIFLSSNESDVTINYSLVCSEPEYVTIDNSAVFQISYVY